MFSSTHVSLVSVFSIHILTHLSPPLSASILPHNFRLSLSLCVSIQSILTLNCVCVSFPLQYISKLLLPHSSSFHHVSIFSSTPSTLLPRMQPLEHVLSYNNATPSVTQTASLGTLMVRVWREGWGLMEDEDVKELEREVEWYTFP